MAYDNPTRFHKVKIGIGWTNFAAVAMETKRGDIK
jgi:hypothetical protein